jgi:hypothetical protein
VTVSVPHILHFDSMTREALLALEQAINAKANGGGGGTGLPPGGVDGQVLTKTSSVDGEADWESPTSGVTDHGLLSGLGDDDHPQYHTDARGDVRYDTKGAASSGDAAHVAATDPHAQYLRQSEVAAGTGITVAGTGGTTGGVTVTNVDPGSTAMTTHEGKTDPHPQYLTPAEVLRGNGITVDTATTPGSAIVKNNIDVDEWTWVAAANTFPGVGCASLDTDDPGVATTLILSNTSATGATPNWLTWLLTGDNLAIGVPGTTRKMRVRVTGPPSAGGSYTNIPIVMYSWNEPVNGATVTITAYYSVGAGTGIDMVTADARYVNVSGDTMTGVLHVPTPLIVDVPSSSPAQVTLQPDALSNQAAFMRYTTDALYIQFVAESSRIPLKIDRVNKLTTIEGDLFTKTWGPGSTTVLEATGSDLRYLGKSLGRGFVAQVLGTFQGTITTTAQRLWTLTATLATNRRYIAMLTVRAVNTASGTTGLHLAAVAQANLTFPVDHHILAAAGPYNSATIMVPVSVAANGTYTLAVDGSTFPSGSVGCYVDNAPLLVLDIGSNP